MKSIIKYASIAALVSSEQLFDIKSESVVHTSQYGSFKAPGLKAADIDDRWHDVKTIVEENGYKFESHEVVTSDGYILTMHRIPSGVKNAPVVLL